MFMMPGMHGILFFIHFFEFCDVQFDMETLSIYLSIYPSIYLSIILDFLFQSHVYIQLYSVSSWKIFPWYHGDMKQDIFLWTSHMPCDHKWPFKEIGPMQMTFPPFAPCSYQQHNVCCFLSLVPVVWNIHAVDFQNVLFINMVLKYGPNEEGVSIPPIFSFGYAPDLSNHCIPSYLIQLNCNDSTLMHQPYQVHRVQVTK